MVNSIIVRSILLVLLGIFSFDIHAQQFSFLTKNKQIDVGSAFAFAADLEAQCQTTYTNQQQAWQCKSSCGLLGDKVANIATTLGRNNVQPNIIKRSIQDYVRTSQQCGAAWRRQQNKPSSLTGFIELYNLFKSGQLPKAGIPQSEKINYKQPRKTSINQLLNGLENIISYCPKTLNTQLCQKECDLVKPTNDFFQLVGSTDLTDLALREEVDGNLEQLALISNKLSFTSQKCGSYFGSNIPLPVQKIYLTSTSLNLEISDIKRKQDIIRQEQAVQKKRKLQQEKAKAFAREQEDYKTKLAQARHCRNDSPFFKLKGCSYLTAIYDGDFDRAAQIEYQSTAPYRKGWVGEANTELTKMLSQITNGALNYSQMMDQMYRYFNFIDKLLGTYIGYYEYYYPTCIESDATIITLTKERQREYRNGFGHLVRTEQLPAFVDTMRVNKRLVPYANASNLDKQTTAQITLVDLFGGAINQHARINYMEVTLGLTQALKKYSCDSSPIRTLEHQMIRYYEKRQLEKH